MRRWRPAHLYAWLWLVVALQAAIPASYYLRSADLDDERFAWRMFSQVRLRRCGVAVTLLDGEGRARQMQVRGQVHSSWLHNLERGRRRVVERFLASRCEREPAPAVAKLRRSCRELGPAGAAYVEEYTWECANQQLTRWVEGNDTR